MHYLHHLLLTFTPHTPSLTLSLHLVLCCYCIPYFIVFMSSTACSEIPLAMTHPLSGLHSKTTWKRPPSLLYSYTIPSMPPQQHNTTQDAASTPPPRRSSSHTFKPLNSFFSYLLDASPNTTLSITCTESTQKPQPSPFTVACLGVQTTNQTHTPAKVKPLHFLCHNVGTTTNSYSKQRNAT